MMLQHHKEDISQKMRNASFFFIQPLCLHIIPNSSIMRYLVHLILHPVKCVVAKCKHASGKNHWVDFQWLLTELDCSEFWDIEFVACLGFFPAQIPVRKLNRQFLQLHCSISLLIYGQLLDSIYQCIRCRFSVIKKVKNKSTGLYLFFFFFSIFSFLQTSSNLEKSSVDLFITFSGIIVFQSKIYSIS